MGIRQDGLAPTPAFSEQKRDATMAMAFGHFILRSYLRSSIGSAGEIASCWGQGCLTVEHQPTRTGKYVFSEGWFDDPKYKGSLAKDSPRLQNVIACVNTVHVTCWTLKPLICIIIIWKLCCTQIESEKSTDKSRNLWVER